MSDDTVNPDNVNPEATRFAPEQLDEILSAELDGEFESAARELGLSVPDAEARIRATPGADERRSALAAARDLLAVAPPIDDLLAARLHAKAVRAAEVETAARTEDRRRRNRILLSAGGIAAAIAAVVAVANGMSGFHPDYASSSKSASSPSPSAERQLAPATHAPAATATAALGSFADARSLAVAAVQRDTVSRNLTDPVKRAVQPASGTSDGRVSAATTAPAPTLGQSETSNSADKVDPSAKSSADQSGQNDSGSQFYGGTGSAATCNAPPEVPAADTPVLRATATLSGKPVIVLVFASATEHVVVIEDTHCKLVNLQMFH